MTNRATTLGRAIRSLVKLEWSPVNDRELLRRYADDGDQEAFAAVVRRHSGLVTGVCRRALTNIQDAEDACQATFLILARKARRGRWQPSVANWLYTTARRVARDARRTAQRRAMREGKAAVPETLPPADPLIGRELQEALDEELDRLSPIYREALVLCYLEGLTRDEVAVRLDIPAGTVKIRLERGRKRLGDALTRRGCALGIGLLTLAATSPAGASPPGLVQAVLAAASGLPPAAVAALAKGVVVNGLVYKSVLALAAVIGVTALRFGAGSEGFSAPGPLPHQVVRTAPDQAPSKGAGAQPAQATDATATYAGRVLGPDGQPVAGAKLYALYYTPKVLPIPQRATSDKDGGFRFSVPGAEFDRSASARPWNETIVMALADGYGLGFPDFQLGQMPVFTQMTVRLVKDDVPITGRIVDLQGQPVAGAAAVVTDLFWSMKGDDLTAWLATLRERKEFYPALHAHQMGQGGLWMGRDIGRILPPAVTGADGRFRLRGVGRERVVALNIEGPTIGTTSLWAMTRPGDTLRVAMHHAGEVAMHRPAGEARTFAGAYFQQIVNPGRPVIGTVRDKDTGKPIGGAVIEVAGDGVGERAQPRAVAGADGRYRLLGVGKRTGELIRVAPPEGQPYLMTLARVPDGPGLEPVTVDVSLKRGVWITGTVTDKATGRPAPSWVYYAVPEDNPNRSGVPGLTFDDNLQTKPADGTFRFVGLPGRGVVAVSAQQAHYLTRMGSDRIKDIDRLFFGRDFHAAAELNPARGTESVTCNLVLEPGRTLTGTVVGPDGQPLAGVITRGLEHDVWDPRPAAAGFRAYAPNPGERRLLQFLHAEKKLAGSAIVGGTDQGPLTVKLALAGTLTGRLVSLDGKPLADLELFAPTTAPQAAPTMIPMADVTAGSFPPGARTDKDGRFRIDGLAPGLNYRLAVRRGQYLLEPEGREDRGVTVKPGETKDLGELKVRLPDQ